MSYNRVLKVDDEEWTIGQLNPDVVPDESVHIVGSFTFVVLRFIIFHLSQGCSYTETCGNLLSK